jgi:RNA polymerase sigma factor (sigma-70 family)
MRKNVTQQSDELLWADLISGNKDAYRIIYECHIQSLYKYGCHFSKDQSLVQDCIQDLFVDLFHYRSRLRRTDNIRGYLFISLKRKIIKKLVLGERMKSLNVDSLPFDYPLICEDSTDSDLNQRLMGCLEKAMNKLSARQKEAIYLKFVVGLSYEDLCSVLHLNYQVTRNLVHRGMEKLRESCRVNFILLLALLSKKMLPGIKIEKN